MWGVVGVCLWQIVHVHASIPPSEFRGLKSLWIFPSLKAPLHRRPHTLMATAAQQRQKNWTKILKHLVVKSKCLGKKKKKRSEVVCAASSISGLNGHAYVAEDSCWYRCVQAPQPAARAVTCCLTFSRHPDMKFYRLPFQQQAAHALASRGSEPAMCDEANGAPVALSDATMSAEASFQSRWVLCSGRLIKGPVLSYRKPNGPAGRRKCGWSARLRPVWPSLRWGMWSMPCHCTGRWSCTKWERHLAGAAGETKPHGQRLHVAAVTLKKHQGEPTSLRMKVPGGMVIKLVQSG